MSAPVAPNSKRPKLIAMIGHAPAIVMSLLPFLNVLLTYLLWYRFRTEGDFVRAHLSQAVNFNILFTVLYAAAWYVIPQSDHAVARVIEIWMIVSATMAVFRAGRKEPFRYWPSVQLIKQQ